MVNCGALMDERTPILGRSISHDDSAGDPPDVVSEAFRWHGSLQSQLSHSEYEELMHGSVPCPSCYGSGRIPKDREDELVALIPISDARLKPRRSCCWIVLAMVLCLAACGAALFFLLPRAVQVFGTAGSIDQVNVVAYSKNEYLKLQFWSSLSVTNWNFYAVQLLNISSQVINRLQPFNHDVIGVGFNSTGISIPIRAKRSPVHMNHTVMLTGTSLRYCELYETTPPYNLMQFEFTLTFEYLGHTEQDTVSVRHQVCCHPSGLCANSTLLNPN